MFSPPNLPLSLYPPPPVSRGWLGRCNYFPPGSAHPIFQWLMSVLVHPYFISSMILGMVKTCIWALLPFHLFTSKLSFNPMPCLIKVLCFCRIGIVVPAGHGLSFWCRIILFSVLRVSARLPSCRMYCLTLHSRWTRQLNRLPWPNPCTSVGETGAST
jgi:hypothetical protein